MPEISRFYRRFSGEKFSIFTFLHQKSKILIKFPLGIINRRSRQETKNVKFQPVCLIFSAISIGPSGRGVSGPHHSSLIPSQALARNFDGGGGEECFAAFMCSGKYKYDFIYIKIKNRHNGQGPNFLRQVLIQNCRRNIRWPLGARRAILTFFRCFCVKNSLC